VASFQILFPTLADGGLYVIEDVQTAFWPDFGGSMLHGGDMIKLARTAIECVNHAELAVVNASRTLPTFAQQVKAFRAFHNIFVIEKGKNCEPSNFAYDLNNPHAATAVKIIEEELDKAPTPEGMANLVDVYLSGRDPARAKEIADKALSLWPENPTLLFGAYRVAKERKDLPAQIGYLERVLRIEADNVVLRERLKEARAAAVKRDT
jgi:tetratricopeptide (TPR) repeat protein